MAARMALAPCLRAHVDENAKRITRPTHPGGDVRWQLVCQHVRCRVLEKRVRQWVSQRGELYVVTGPVYIGARPRTLGKNGVAIPSHFYKVAFDPVRIEAIAFLLPNKRLSSHDLPRFITSIDDIEQATGLDFLQNLSDPVEDIVESTVQNRLW